MSNMLPTPYQQFIHKSRYARWLDNEQRRENWDETVDRYVGFMENQIQGKCNVKLDKKVTDELREGILSLDVMPSMRAMMTAGSALARDNICGYNCSYIPVDSPRAFDECMYILMCGTGVGFSVERENVDKLPVVSDNFGDSDIVITVGDSKPGWAKALRELIALLYAGQVPSWDMSQVRPAGERLKIMGGRASGPQPLADLFNFVVETFKKAKGRRLFPIECHDLMCKIGEIVVPFFPTVSQVNVVCSTVRRQTSKSVATDAVSKATCGVQIPALRLSCVATSSVTCQRWWFVKPTRYMI